MQISCIYGHLQTFSSETYAEISKESWHIRSYLLFRAFSFSTRTMPVHNIPIWWAGRHLPTTIETLFVLLNGLWWFITALSSNFLNSVRSLYYPYVLKFYVPSSLKHEVELFISSCILPAITSTFQLQQHFTSNEWASFP